MLLAKTSETVEHPCAAQVALPIQKGPHLIQASTNIPIPITPRVLNLRKPNSGSRSISTTSQETSPVPTQDSPTRARQNRWREQSVQAQGRRRSSTLNATSQDISDNPQERRELVLDAKVADDIISRKPDDKVLFWPSRRRPISPPPGRTTESDEPPPTPAVHAEITRLRRENQNLKEALERERCSARQMWHRAQEMFQAQYFMQDESSNQYPFPPRDASLRTKRNLNASRMGKQRYASSGLLNSDMLLPTESHRLRDDPFNFRTDETTSCYERDGDRAGGGLHRRQGQTRLNQDYAAFRNRSDYSELPLQSRTPFESARRWHCNTYRDLVGSEPTDKRQHRDGSTYSLDSIFHELLPPYLDNQSQSRRNFPKFSNERTVSG